MSYDSRPLPERHDLLKSKYEDLLESDQEPSDYILAISGGRGTGTSKHASDLSVEFGIDHLDNGTAQRQAAEENGYETDEDGTAATKFRSENEKADLVADARKLEHAYSGEPLIGEGRLDAASLSAPRSKASDEPIATLRVKMTCDDWEQRAGRYADDEGKTDVEQPEDISEEVLKDAREEIVDQDERIYSSFAKIYDGVEPRNEAYYDTVIDNSGDYLDSHREPVYELIEAGFRPERLSESDLEDIGV
ncbi:MAG: hypothetical protein BRC29_02600 [Nanohaloarchaea archaeon SW_7_43_1]|nr:MAG: hypothetical protein BRC29_02600 [Nanohaloarchaea archaeon SW_7_43_1]